MTSDTTRLLPSDSFADPRTEPGFNASHWPLCNGGEGPLIGATDHHSRRCIEFLAAYYLVNCRQGELAASRKAHASNAEIKARLDAVAAALEAVDALEDRYVSIGFYGEPAMNGFFYESIRFERPEVPRIFRELSTHSSHLAIPGLEEIPMEELRGPVVVTRWPHGKVDL